jgi:hypothetical protein
LTIDSKEIAKFMAAYAKNHGAGAFATPLPDEISKNPEMIRQWTSDNERVVVAQKRLSRHSTRTDFTGRKFVLPAGSNIITHLARTPNAAIPDLSDYDYINGYLEDLGLTASMIAANRRTTAVRVSASSELIGVWAFAGNGYTYSHADHKTFTKVDVPTPLPLDDMRKEVAEVQAWHDDFPYYSDGTWSAVSLRGYKPDDPSWGVKPSEMPKKWLDEHPDAVDLECDWTTLAARTPVIVNWVKSIPWMQNLERVRLFRMDAKKGGGKLGRHSDIQDKAVGTKDGCLARFHIPIVTHPDITMTAWRFNGTSTRAHLAEGGIYYLDTRKPHAVANDSPINRVHLVVDVVVNSAVRDVISNSIEM